MDLLEYLKMSFLHFNVAMIYIIHKMLGLLKNHVIYIKNGIFKCFLKEYKRPFFGKHIIIESLSLEEENIIK